MKQSDYRAPSSGHFAARPSQWLYSYSIAAAAVATAFTLAVSNAAAIGVSTGQIDLKTKDFGPTPSGVKIAGQNIGNLGYWFPNFDGPAPVVNQPVDQHAASALPSWLSVQFNPAPPSTYSFSTSATSTGGQPTFNTFILPNGTSAIAGLLVDNLNASSPQTHSIIDNWNFGPGTPSSFYLSVVIDSIGKDTPTPVNGPIVIDQLRATIYAPDNSNTNAGFTNLAAVSDGKGDAYTFLLTGAQPGGHFSLQLATLGNAAGTADTALGGLLFTKAVPEPSTLATLAVACVSLGGGRLLRRRLPRKS